MRWIMMLGLLAVGCGPVDDSGGGCPETAVYHLTYEFQEVNGDCFSTAIEERWLWVDGDGAVFGPTPEEAEEYDNWDPPYEPGAVEDCTAELETEHGTSTNRRRTYTTFSLTSRTGTGRYQASCGEVFYDVTGERVE